MTIGTIALLFVLSCAAIPLLGFVYMPAQTSDEVSVTLTMPVGTKIEVTEAVLQQLEQFVYGEVKGYKNVTLLVGSSSNFSFGGSTSYTGLLTVSLPPLKDRIDSEDEIKEKLKEMGLDLGMKID